MCLDHAFPREDKRHSCWQNIVPQVSGALFREMCCTVQSCRVEGLGSQNFLLVYLIQEVPPPPFFFTVMFVGRPGPSVCYANQLECFSCISASRTNQSQNRDMKIAQCTFHTSLSTTTLWKSCKSDHTRIT